MRLVNGIHHGTKRKLKELTIDKVDLIYRLVTGQMHLPPFTLREFVGGAQGFENVGPWFLREFSRLDLIKQGGHIFDIGCGCGRLAYTFAKESKKSGKNIKYTGMDVDKKSIEWCSRNISKMNPGFSFYHVDLKSVTYNPNGEHDPKTYRFPHADSSFDLIILTSVFSHLLEEEVKQYLRELQRVLTPSGTVYASFFTYQNKQDAVEGVSRRHQRFPYFHDHYALESERRPENAVAYQDAYLRSLFEASGLTLRQEPMYGLQDVFLLARK